MTPEDMQTFNRATQLPASDGYRLLEGLAGRYPSDANLLAWLIFTAPDYPAKQQWADRARSVAPFDETVKRAISWFDQQPKPAPVMPSAVTPPPAPNFNQPPMRMQPQPFGMPDGVMLGGQSQQQFANQQFAQQQQYPPQGYPPNMAGLGAGYGQQQPVIVVQQVAAPQPQGRTAGQNSWWPAVVAGVLLIVSAFLPWVTSDARRDSLSGLDTDGVFVMVIGIFAGIIGLSGAFQRTQKPITRIIAGGFLILLGIIALYIAGRIGVIAQDTYLITLRPGIGLMLAFVAGLLMAISGLIIAVTANKK